MTEEKESKLERKLDKILELKGIDTDHISYFNKHLKEIRDDVLAIKEKVDSHDKLMKDVNDILPDLKSLIAIYKTASPVVRLSGRAIIGVPLLAGFIAGLIYIKDLFKN